jgi:hypothetical protein
MNKDVPDIEVGADGKWHCPEPNCKKPVWSKAWGFKVHWARMHGSKKHQKREDQKAKAKARYQAKKRVQAHPEPDLDYTCPICSTPQGPIIRGIKEAISQRIACQKELTQ